VNEPGTISRQELSETAWLVALSGEHDLATAPEVRRAIDAATRPGSTVVLDLSAATFIDSRVIGEIVEGAREGELVVVAVPGTEPRRVLDIVGAGNVVTLVDDREAALSKLEP
jgi:anti-sigma B factor antagonist